MTLATALNLSCLAAAALLAAHRARRALHLWQMDSYLNRRYLRWLFAKPLERYLDLPALALAAASLLSLPPVAIAPPWLAWVAWQLLRKDTTPVKKPLDMTRRARRTLLLARLLIAAATLLAGLLASRSAAALPLAALLAHAAPWSILLANLCLTPWRNAENARFVAQARARLSQLQPLVIGVAGSYGKTSTKYFLDVLLSKRHHVLKSPGNFNTLLGITRVVNDMLRPEHRILIAEMGAYQRGEVKEIADLVHPTIGIITSIGPEHFERFLTMENIEATNYELIESLPASGLAVFNGDNPHCRQLAARTTHTRVALYGLSPNPAFDLWAENLHHTSHGLSFDIVLRDTRRLPVATRIVGRHNVLNILGATRIALELNLPLDAIATAIAELQPAPHRLAVNPSPSGAIIIDDSYNSNPIGAAEALHVLSQFRSGRRFLVTPGMIELGVLHYQENEKLGFLAAQSADIVILIGPQQTKPLQDGLRRAGFPESNLYIVKDLTEATAIFQNMLRPGDAILFENDLPDLYTEK
jgi:UDP-N-acetylmuramoyl-tripeptide--D-alanyl-D-alanine ligase